MVYIDYFCGYKKTTEVVKKNKLTHPLDDPFPDGMGKQFKKKYENIELEIPEPGKLKINNGLIDALMSNDKEKSNNRIYEPAISLEGRSKRIVDWIKSHPGFKWSWMCSQIKIDKSNFKRIIDSKKPMLKSEACDKIELILKLYGL